MADTPAQAVASVQKRVAAVENTLKTTVKADVAAAHDRIDQVQAQMASHWRWIAVIGLGAVVALVAVGLVALHII